MNNKKKIIFAILIISLLIPLTSAETNEGGIVTWVWNSITGLWEKLIDGIFSGITASEIDSRLGTIDTKNVEAHWNIVKQTGNEANFDVILADEKDKKTDICFVLKEGINPASVDLTDKILTYSNGTPILDDKNKQIVLKYETAKCDVNGEMKDGYHILLTDAKAVNIDDNIKFGENSLVLVYQEENLINYDLDFAEVNLTLSSESGLINDLFVFYDNVSLKFGANDSEIGLKNYTYHLVSDKPLFNYDTTTPYLINPNYYGDLYKEYETHVFNFNDICSRAFECSTEIINGTEVEVCNKTASCKFEYSSEVIDENTTFYYLDVHFLSDENIDPTITISSTDAFTDAFEQDTTAEGSFSHLDVDNNGTSIYDNLVGYWSFDGDNTGAFSKAVIERGANFDGAGDYVEKIGSIADDAISVSAWVRVDGEAGGGTYPFFGLGVSSNPSFLLNFGAQKRPLIYMGPSNLRYFNYSEYNTIVDGDWHHVVFVLPGNSNSSIESSALYVDTYSSLPTTTDSSGAQNSRTLARMGGVGVYYFNGSIDEVMIFNRSLSQAEITALYNNQSAGLKAYESDADLVGYWTLDDTFEDYTANNNDGVPKGNLKPTTAYDFSNLGNDATYYNDAFTEKEMYDDAFNSDGAGDYLRATVSGFPITQDTTFMAWVNLKEFAGTRSDILYGINEFALSLELNTGKVAVQVHGGGTWSGTAKSASGIGTDNWVFIAGRYNGTTIQTFVDGVASGSPVSETGTLGALTAIDIGGASNHVNGSIDEVMIFNISLTDQQILDIYNNQSQRFKSVGNFTLKQFNITAGNNTVNVSTGIENNFGSNVSLRLGEWEVSDGYTDTLSTSPTDLNYGLVGYWHGDNNDSSDSSGLGNDGTFYGNANANADGMMAQGFEFDGVGDYVDVGSASILDGSQIGLSAFAWVKLNTYTNYQGIVSKSESTPGGDDWIIYLSNDASTWRAYFNGSYVESSDTLNTGEWVLVGFSWDSTTGNVSLYQDGVLQDNVIENKDSFSSASGAEVVIGRAYDDFDGLYWNGSIDEVMIFNRSLSEQEIKELYVKGRANWDYTAEQNLTDATNATFTISTTTTNILPDFKHYAGTNQFYTPIQWGDVNIEYFTLSGGVDTTPPTFTNVHNVTHYTNESVLTYYNATDETSFGTWAVNDTTNFQINSTGSLSNITTLSVGIIYLNLTINDSSNNLNSTIINVTTLEELDLISPSVSIVFPINGTNTTDTQLNVNYTASDETLLDSCWYTNDSGLNNYTLTCGINITIATWIEGLNNITIYANDSSNNLGSADVTFRLDTTAPTITQPANATLEYKTEPLSVDFDATDDGVGVESWAINDTTNFQINTTGGLINLTELSLGTYQIIIYVNDTLNNTNSTTYQVDVQDTIAPVISAYNISSYNNQSIVGYYNATDVDSVTWLIDDTINFSINSTGGLTNITTLTVGVYFINVTANDSSNNPSSVNVNVTINNFDTFKPYFSTIPSNATLEFKVDSLGVDFDAVDSEGNFDSYEVNDTTNFQINSTGWLSNITSLAIGTYYLNISINDTLGNTNETLYQVDVQDTIAPNINIITPENGSSTTSLVITLSVETDDVDITQCNYTKNMDGTNNTFTLPNEDILFAIADNQTLEVYCADASGNLGYNITYFNVTSAGGGGGICGVSNTVTRVNATSLLFRTSTYNAAGTKTNYALTADCRNATGDSITSPTLTNIATGQYEGFYTSSGSGSCEIRASGCSHNPVSWTAYFGGTTTSQGDSQCDLVFNYTQIPYQNKRPYLQLCKWRNFK